MANSQLSRYVAGQELSRQSFGSDFLWGAATSHYQVEGAFTEGGKGISNADVFYQNNPAVDGSNGSFAIDHYNRYKDDVTAMTNLGLDSYRFSIAWTRILPTGKLSGGVNKEGVKFYSDLINHLLSKNITPCVTLFHFDVPETLESEYGGFLDPRIRDDFGDFAQVCFSEFGDRVKMWVTLNEPYSYIYNGYVVGVNPPGRSSEDIRSLAAQNPATFYRLPHGLLEMKRTKIVNCDLATEPYILAHNLLLAHAKAVKIYRDQFQAVQRGKIGITNMTTWYDPYRDDNEDDRAAAQRAVDFKWGWFVRPVVYGEYPSVMRHRVGSRLPTFTPEQKRMIQGSYDFLGVNYYTTNLVSPSNSTHMPPGYDRDVGVDYHTTRPNGEPIGPQAGSEWLIVYPDGIYKLLRHTKDTYGDNIIMYITENGVNERNLDIPLNEALADEARISYYVEHLKRVKQAIEDGVKVKGYYAWSLFDNFEWSEGYTVRFGLYYVDFVNNLTRYPKQSAIWFMNFLNKNRPKLISPMFNREVEEPEDNAVAVKKRKSR